MALEWVGIEEAVVLGREGVEFVVHIGQDVLDRWALRLLSLEGSMHGGGVYWKRRKA